MRIFLFTVMASFFVFNSLNAQEAGAGYKLDFDGTNDYIAVSKVNLFIGLTYSAWIKTTSTDAISGSASNPALVIIGDHTNNIWNSFGVHGGKVRYIHYTGSYQNVTGATSVNDGKWHHVAVTHSQSTNAVVIYVDGLQDATGTLTYAGGGGSVKVGFDRIGGSYLNATGTADFFDGDIDEVCVFSEPITQTEIRDWMCRKLTSSHTSYANLVAYYKFDENAGTTLIDSAGSNNGTLTGGPSYGLSGAAIGDESAHSYGSGNSTTITETHADGSSFKIDNFTGTPDGAHVYLVNESPNSNTNSLSGNLEETRYYGTFIAGGTSPTYSATYDYSGNGSINGIGTESESRLTKRADNSVSSWTLNTNSEQLDTSTNEIQVCNESARAEYIAGFDNTVLQERPGSGYTLDFDGSNDYVSLSSTNLPTGNSARTIEGWIKTTQSSNGSMVNWSSAGAIANQRAGFMIISSGVIHVVAASNDYSGTTAVNDGKWHHVAVSFDGTTSSLYIDGVLDASAAKTYNTMSAIFSIGRNQVGAEYYNGEIDEVKIWNTALSQSEIRDWMCKKITSSHPKYCNLVSYYRFDENTGSTLTDYAGSNNGTLTGGPSYGLSGAALGDESTHSYGSGNSTTITETHADGSSFKIDNFTGAPDGAHVYLVNESPHSNTNSLSGNLEETRYYGTFIAGGTSPTYSATYDYSGNTNIDGIGTESESRLTKRAGNSIASWSLASNKVELDETNNSISICSETQGEYIAGFDNTVLQERPGSGYALDFDGSNDYVRITDDNSLDLLNGWTIESWVKSDDIGAVQDIVSKYGWSLGGGGYILRIISSRATAYVLNGTSVQSIQGSTTLSANTWYHLSATFNPSTNTLKVYVNSILDDQNTSTTINPTAGGTDLAIGVRGDGFNNYTFDGNIDEVRIWNTDLSQTQIRDWMCKKLTSSHPQYCNLVSYYRFDENTGSTLTDYAGSNNGTLTGGPTYALSGASLGDESAYSYSGTPSATLGISGDTLSIGSFTGSPTGVHVFYVNEKPNTLSGSQGVGSNDSYFGVFKVGDASATYSATFNYSGNPNVSAANESTLALYKRASNATSSWTNAGATLNTTANTLTATGQNTEYMLGSTGVALPVELLNFNLRLNRENEVELHWQTASELNNDYFIIERSRDAIHWEDIDKIDGAGNSQTIVSYFALDKSPLLGTSYYRLKQVDIEGQFEHSDIKSIRIDSKGEKNFRIYPNPVSNELFIEGDVDDIRLYNSQGIELEISIRDNGSGIKTVDVSYLSQGVYILKVDSKAMKVVRE